MKQVLILASALVFASATAQACPFSKSAEKDASLTTASIMPSHDQQPQMSERKDQQAYEPDFDDADPGSVDTSE